MEGSGTQKCGYQKWPNQNFPTVNFVVSYDGPFGRGGGGGTTLPPAKYGPSNISGGWRGAGPYRARGQAQALNTLKRSM